MGDIKTFLYAWLGKQKITPNYDIRAAGSKHRQRFLCEVSFFVSLFVPISDGIDIDDID